MANRQASSAPYDWLPSSLAEISKRTAFLPVDFHISKQQVEAGFLWSIMTKKSKREVSPVEVATALGKRGESGRVSVSNSLKAFRSNAPLIRKLNDQLYWAGFLTQKYRVKRHIEILADMRERRRKKFEEGLWVGTVPFGAMELPDGKAGILQWNPELETKIARFWKALAEGKKRQKALEEAGIEDKHQEIAVRLVRNPAYRAYARESDRGCVRYKDERGVYQLREGKHRALVDYYMWEKAMWYQEARKDDRAKFGLLFARPYKLTIVLGQQIDLMSPHGSTGRPVVDPTEKARLVQIRKLFDQRMNALEIGRRVGLDPHVVRAVLRDKDGDYGGLLGKDWKLAPGLVELWLGRGRQQRRMVRNELRVLAGLVTLGGAAGTYKIAKEVRMSSQIHMALGRLKDKGWLDRKPGHKGAWFVTDMEAAKRLIASRPAEVPLLKRFLES